MSASSQYTTKKVGEHMLRGTASTTPGEVFLALFTSNPGPDGAGTEANYPGYARQTAGATPSAAFSSIGVDGKTSNQASMTWPPNGGSTDVVVGHWAIYDAAVGGNLLFFGQMQASKRLEPTDVLSLPAGNLTMEFV